MEVGVGAVDVGLKVVEDRLKAGRIEEGLDIFGVTVELVQGGGGEGGLPGGAGAACGFGAVGGALDRAVDRRGILIRLLLFRTHNTLPG